jgi:hypothetical protein
LEIIVKIFLATTKIFGSEDHPASYRSPVVSGVLSFESEDCQNVKLA